MKRADDENEGPESNQREPGYFMVRYFSFALKYNKWMCFLKKQGLHLQKSRKFHT